MKKYLAATAFLVVFLSVLIPFASSNPDGLEKVAESLGVEKPEPVWNGLMSDYNVGASDNQYASTLAAGILGIVIVLGAVSILGYTITKRPASTNI